MDSYINYGRQDINDADIQSVIKVLQSGWLTQGSEIDRFEQIVADYCGAKYAIAVSSATAALHIACLAIGLSDGDYLWTSPNTFVASANCGLYCGAKVDFVDIDPNTYNLSVQALERKLIDASKKGCIPKVLVPVHFAGQSCDMEKIAALSRQYGFSVLEDASHAIGGNYKERQIGCCEFSDLAVFSFHPVKMITTGEGGMILTNRKDMYEKLIRLRSHGITRNQDLMQGESHGAWYYQQLELGFNYRMTDIQATLGSSQMTRLEKFVEKRVLLAGRYNELLKNLPITLPLQNHDTESSWHLYAVRIHTDKTRRTHTQIFDELRQAGIGVNLHYIPVHCQPYYQEMGFKVGDFPESEAYYANAITIPLHYQLTEQEQDRVVSEIRKLVA